MFLVNALCSEGALGPVLTVPVSALTVVCDQRCIWRLMLQCIAVEHGQACTGNAASSPRFPSHWLDIQVSMSKYEPDVFLDDRYRTMEDRLKVC